MILEKNNVFLTDFKRKEVVQFNSMHIVTCFKFRGFDNSFMFLLGYSRKYEVLLQIFLKSVREKFGCLSVHLSMI